MRSFQEDVGRLEARIGLVLEEIKAEQEGDVERDPPGKHGTDIRTTITLCISNMERMNDIRLHRISIAFRGRIFMGISGQ